MFRIFPIIFLLFATLIFSCRKNVEIKSELLQEFGGGEKNASGKYVGIPKTFQERNHRLSEILGILEKKYGAEEIKWKIITDFIGAQTSEEYTKQLHFRSIFGPGGTGKTTVVKDLIDLLVEYKIIERTYFQIHPKSQVIDIAEYTKPLRFSDQGDAETGIEIYDKYKADLKTKNGGAEITIGDPIAFMHKKWKDAWADLNAGKITQEEFDLIEEIFLAVRNKYEGVVVVDEGSNSIGAIPPSYKAVLDEFTSTPENPIPEADPKDPYYGYFIRRKETAIAKFEQNVEKIQKGLTEIWAAFTDGGEVTRVTNVDMSELVDRYEASSKKYFALISSYSGVQKAAPQKLYADIVQIEAKVKELKAIEGNNPPSEDLKTLNSELLEKRNQLANLGFGLDELKKFTDDVKVVQDEMNLNLRNIVDYFPGFAEYFTETFDKWTEKSFPDKDFLKLIKSSSEFGKSLEGWKNALKSSPKSTLVEAVLKIAPIQTAGNKTKALNAARVYRPGDTVYIHGTIFVISNTQTIDDEIIEYARPLIGIESNDEIVDGSAQIVKKYIDPKKPIDLADTSNKFVAQIRAMFGIVIAKDGSQTIDNLGAFESRLNIKNAYYVPPPKTASWRAFVKIKLNERAMQIKRRFASSRVKKNIYYDESVVELFALKADVTYSFRTFQRELDALVGVESLVNTGEAIENENLIIVHSDGKLKIFPFPGNLAVPESSIIRGFVPNEETVLKWVDAPSFDLPGSKYTPEEILPRTARAQQYYWENVVSMLYNGSAPKQLDLATKDTQDAFDGIFKNWEFFDAATDSEGARKAYLELIESNKALIHITRYTYDMIYGGSISDLPTRKKNKEEIYNLLNGLLNSARKELRAADGESIAETIQHGFPDDYAAHPVIAILIKNKGDLDKTFADLQSYLKVNIFDNNKFKDLAKKYGDLLQNQVELKDLLILKNQEIRIAKSKYSEDSEVLKKLLNEKADLESDLAKLSQKLGGGYFADDLIKAGNESSFPNKNVFKHLKDRRRGIFYIENIQILRDLNAVKDDFLHRLYRRIRNICARGR